MKQKTCPIRHMIFWRGGDIIAVVIMLLQRYTVNVYHDYAQFLLSSVIRRVMLLGLLFPVPLIWLSTGTHFQKHTKFQYTIGLSVVFPSSVYCWYYTEQHNTAGVVHWLATAFGDAVYI